MHLAWLLLFAIAQYDAQLVSRLPRVDGAVPERVCPVHSEVMTVELVPIGWGLLSIEHPAFRPSA